MVFAGTRHCPHCGTRAHRAETLVPEDVALSCPRCAGQLNPVQVGGARLRECARCAGVWVAPDDFTRVTADAEQQAAVLRFRGDGPPPAPVEASVRYLPCPGCGTLMHRANFQRISGVIIDQCRDHGAWLDADELRRVVEFIRGGGLERAREREKRAIEEDRQRVQRMLREAEARAHPAPLTSAPGPVTTDLVLKTLFRLIGL
jgi:Zn-finger nucleic acid-binding protein